MEVRVCGTVLAVDRQWLLKVNRKPFSRRATDGIKTFHPITVQYTVDGREYIRKKWFDASTCPDVGDAITVICLEDKPKKIRLERKVPL
ncbi:MAG: sugar ABC transporter permease [Clostridia bacterium]|nr:sugar ABC transporter permease [Clostridia bacterium]